MNQINVIAPYRHLDMWVFDDPRVGLSQEPFVGGADTMLDRVTSVIAGAENGFVLVFSGESFPGFQFHLEWIRPDGSGNVYYSKELDAEGWLCPALLRYFDSVPSNLFIQVKPAAPRASGGGLR